MRGNSSQKIAGITVKNGFQFREGQQIFLERLTEAFRRGETNHLGVFIPGYGKTITALAAFVVAYSLQAAKKLVIFVPRGNLRDQYANPQELSQIFQQMSSPQFSFCVADSERAFLKNISTHIIITTYQYASGAAGHKALLRFCEESPCMFIFDEVHHLSDDGTWAQRISQFPHSCSVALSGTPMRADNKTLFGVPFELNNNNGKIEQYYKALHEVTLRAAHCEGKILKRVAAHIIDYSIRLKHKETGETVTLSLEQMTQLTEGNEDIDIYLARKNLRFHEVYLASLLEPAFERFSEKRNQLGKSPSGRTHQLLIIAMSNLHAQAMLEFIRGRFPQFRTERIGQDIPESIRLPHLEEYRNGFVDVMVQVDMIGEGTDIKPISVIVKSDLVRAQSKTMQQIFRGMRYFPPFGEEHNICDIYVAKDSGVAELLEWVANEEQSGILLKEKRILDGAAERTLREREQERWELQNVLHQQTETHDLQLFPGMVQQTASVYKGIVAEPAGAVNISEQEQKLRQDCAVLAARLSSTLKVLGKKKEVVSIHAEAKKRFSKSQEEMSIAELQRKKHWLEDCLKQKRILQ